MVMKGNVVKVPPRLTGDGDADRSPPELPWALLGLVLGDGETNGVDERDTGVAVIKGVGEAGAGVPVGDGESVGAAAEVVEGEGDRVDRTSAAAGGGLACRVAPADLCSAG